MKFNKLIIMALLLIGQFLSTTIAKEHLWFNEEGKFKIVQLTDIHLAESDQADDKTLAVISTVLKTENPDLVFITGDAVSGYEWNGDEKDFFKSKYSKLTNLLTEFNVKWALTAGNHDTEADLSRFEISEFDWSYPLSMT